LADAVSRLPTYGETSKGTDTEILCFFVHEKGGEKETGSELPKRATLSHTDIDDFAVDDFEVDVDAEVLVIYSKPPALAPVRMD